MMVPGALQVSLHICSSLSDMNSQEMGSIGLDLLGDHVWAYSARSPDSSRGPSLTSWGGQHVGSGEQGTWGPFPGLSPTLHSHLKQPWKGLLQDQMTPK